MAEDVNVKSVRLLQAYQNSFRNFSSAAQQKIFSYYSTLENCAGRARNAKNGIHHIFQIRKHELYRAQVALAKATSSSPPNPKAIMVATKKYEGCKKAFDFVKQCEENCEKMLKKLHVGISQAQQPCLQYKHDLSQTSANGETFLRNYTMKLQSYSSQNG